MVFMIQIYFLVEGPHLGAWGLLYLALEPSAQERHGTVGGDPEEGHRKDQSDRTTETVGIFQTEEQKALERQYCSLSAHQGPTRDGDVHPLFSRTCSK